MNRLKRDADEEMLNRFMRSLLTILPTIIGFGIFLFGKGSDRLTISLGLFISGFTGVIIVIRKEIPIPMGSIHGNRAVVEGFLFTCLLWAISLYIFLFGL